MLITINPPRSQWRSLTRRNIPVDDPQVQTAVNEVIAQVSAHGDQALIDLALKFDHTHIAHLEVSQQEIDEAVAQVPADLKEAIARAAANIEAFHRAQLMHPCRVTTMPGVFCEQRQVPIDTVGLYIPGGRAPLFSTVLMLALPARIAGCREVVLCTPQSGDSPISPAILYAARFCGVHRIFRVGGAQAIAAMALGTESVPRVDKIFGPGNRYVTKAKQTLSTITAIDMPAGPSEVLVMADSTASSVFVASDMLSQAEHGPDSQAMLVCDSEAIASSVAQEIERQLKQLKRGDSLNASLDHSHIIVLDSRADMIDFANAYAAEHLIISMAHPWEVASHITAAGSVFIGNYSPESAGDYASGTNHTLPTGGWARAMSGVNTDSFFRKITYQEITPEGLQTLAPTIVTMADAEGLDAHAAAVKVRLIAECADATESVDTPAAPSPLDYVRASIKRLEPYSTARDDFKGAGTDISVWIDANESPYNNGVNRYPDPHQRNLKKGVALLKGVPEECIFIGGAGSDEAIDLTYRIFCEPRVDNAVAIAPSYGVYQVAADINDVELRQVPLGPGYSLPVEALLEAADSHTKLIWICSPNNPTGNAFDIADICALASRFRGMVVVDEAYVDFSTRGTLLPLITTHPNIIVLQTFSKAWGMASLRAGMAFAVPEIASIYARVKYPYNMNGPTQAELLRRIGADIAPQVAEIVEQRKMLERELPAIPCVLQVYPSDANFLLVRVTDPDDIYRYLIDNGVIVRNRNKVPGCEGSLRITVGTPTENERVLQLLKHYKV